MRHYLVLVTILMTGCNNGAVVDIVKDEPAKTQLEAVANVMDTIKLDGSEASLVGLSNGRLRASLKSDLNFKGSGYVEQLNYANGDYVTSGSVIAVLNCEDENIRLKEAVNQLKKAELEYQDVLVGFGYLIKDTANSPLATREIARIKSGYNTALTNLENAKNGMNGRIIKAPFSGKIANLKTKKHENPKGTFFCSIVNDNAFDVEFSVLESEIGKVREGMEVSISTLTNPGTRYRCRIKSINPTVGDNGQIEILATLANRYGNLMDGMNVKVFILPSN